MLARRSQRYLILLLFLSAFIVIQMKQSVDVEPLDPPVVHSTTECGLLQKMLMATPPVMTDEILTMEEAFNLDMDLDDYKEYLEERFAKRMERFCNPC